MHNNDSCSQQIQATAERVISLKSKIYSTASAHGVSGKCGPVFEISLPDFSQYRWKEEKALKIVFVVFNKS